jgi:hypothetical protein
MGKRIGVHANDAAIAIDPQGIALASGWRVPADVALVSTRAAATAPSIRESSFAKDEHGFLAIGPGLQVLRDDGGVSAPDCWRLRRAAGPTLTRNLWRTFRGEKPERQIPQRDHLVPISTRDGRATSERGRFIAFEGRLVVEDLDRPARHAPVRAIRRFPARE